MILEIKGFTEMHKSNAFFDKWTVFDTSENKERYQLCARDRDVNDENVNAVAIQIYKEPVYEVAANTYNVKIAYNKFGNIIWEGYVRYSLIKDKSAFFSSMLKTITQYENGN